MKIMTKAFSIIFFSLFFAHCSAQKNDTVWKIDGLKTNYVSKGISDTDYYTPPEYLKGAQVRIKDMSLDLSKIRKRYQGSLSREFGDTVIFDRKILFKKQKNNDYCLQYPGDEFSECINSKYDTCNACEVFFNLMGSNKNYINAYVSSSKHSMTKIILFIIKENKEMVLYSENDFLLIFLSKKTN